MAMLKPFKLYIKFTINKILIKKYIKANICPDLTSDLFPTYQTTLQQVYKHT